MIKIGDTEYVILKVSSAVEALYEALYTDFGFRIIGAKTEDTMDIQLYNIVYNKSYGVIYNGILLSSDKSFRKVVADYIRDNYDEALFIDIFIDFLLSNMNSLYIAKHINVYDEDNIDTNELFIFSSKKCPLMEEYEKRGGQRYGSKFVVGNKTDMFGIIINMNDYSVRIGHGSVYSNVIKEDDDILSNTIFKYSRYHLVINYLRPIPVIPMSNRTVYKKLSKQKIMSIITKIETTKNSNLDYEDISIFFREE